MTLSSGSVDANILLRLLLNDVPDQHEMALLLLRDGNQLVVSDTAFIETIFVLGRAYGLTREQQSEAVLGLLHQPAIGGNKALFELAFDDYVKHPKLSFEDCYLVAAAHISGNAPLWTFDKKLASQTDARSLTADNLVSE